MTRSSRALFASLAGLLAASCAGGPLGAPAPDQLRFEGPRALPEAGPGVLRMRWTRTLLEWYEGPYVPVEPAGPALDPANNRIFQGTTKGILYGFDAVGTLRLRYDAGDAIEATPAIDSARGEIYVPVADGSVHALDVQTGTRKWREELGYGIRNAPVLTDDAVYVVTEANRVMALSREDGAVLWTYRRPPGAEFSVAGQAGLALHEDRLFTGFSDGVVVALRPSDGGVLWEMDTSVDAPDVDANRPSFSDVDTTPVVIGDTLYVASYAAGLYALDARNGSVEWRLPERTGIVELADAGRWLILLSALQGVTALDLESREEVWRRRIERGSPSSALVLAERGLLLYGETRGPLVAVSVREGQELARLESGHGFSAPPGIVSGMGAVISNTGKLFVFQVPGEQRRTAYGSTQSRR